MCGIIGYLGKQNAVPVLINGLRRLEYRGYDSAGLVVIGQNGEMIRERAVGKIDALAKKIENKNMFGSVGIAHTRWATHGGVTEENAHPHFSCDGKIALAHNGIIENYRELKTGLLKDHKFTSETDSEVLAHLIEHFYHDNLRLAVEKALALVVGTYGIAVVSSAEPQKIVCARRGSPLVLGVADDAFLIAFDQPQVFQDALAGRLLPQEGAAHLGGLNLSEEKLRQIERIVIIACGTAFYASLIGKYAIEHCTGLPVSVEIASEFRYRDPVILPHTLVLAVSQSGETADTLAAMREAKNKGAIVMGVVNVVGSTIAREAGRGVYIHAGPELAVASTKAFTNQAAILVLLGLQLGRQRRISLVKGQQIIEEIKQIPEKMKKILAQSEDIKKIAEKYQDYEHMFFLGRGINYPLAMEGALKLKEISYIHAEGYPAGEMKHGPIALIDEKCPVFGIMTKDSLYDKTRSNIEEIRARKGKVILLATEGDEEASRLAEDVIFVPSTMEMLEPFLNVLPLQLFAYHMAVLRGKDVDRPRNLAKSVTVE
ncbi:MAG: glutamine--fructose-6-phosphate transaminase (isomerizing) [Candidatus Magasanikbacteria bacterium]|nr:glutamine--fructose-6-phosphate transaminase (isomerizing) [Candidatus Magasanikbacteria bacterium]